MTLCNHKYIIFSSPVVWPLPPHYSRIDGKVLPNLPGRHWLAAPSTSCVIPNYPSNWESHPKYTCHSIIASKQLKYKPIDLLINYEVLWWNGQVTNNDKKWQDNESLLRMADTFCWFLSMWNPGDIESYGRLFIDSGPTWLNLTTELFSPAILQEPESGAFDVIV